MVGLSFQDRRRFNLRPTCLRPSSCTDHPHQAWRLAENTEPKRTWSTRPIRPPPPPASRPPSTSPQRPPTLARRTSFPAASSRTAAPPSPTTSSPGAQVRATESKALVSFCPLIWLKYWCGAFRCGGGGG
jgi:hypothetical protein